jgi:hypothetical protein
MSVDTTVPYLASSIQLSVSVDTTAPYLASSIQLSVSVDTTVPYLASSIQLSVSVDTTVPSLLPLFAGRSSPSWEISCSSNTQIPNKEVHIQNSSISPDIYNM